ncbi:unnamed protein product [Arctogadus glacialis]
MLCSAAEVIAHPLSSPHPLLTLPGGTGLPLGKRRGFGGVLSGSLALYGKRSVNRSFGWVGGGGSIEQLCPTLEEGFKVFVRRARDHCSSTESPWSSRWLNSNGLELLLLSSATELSCTMCKAVRKRCRG